jgi:hypothetical protein
MRALLVHPHPITFRLETSTVGGRTLLCWTTTRFGGRDGYAPYPQSVMLETEVAEYIAGLAAENARLRAALEKRK